MLWFVNIEDQPSPLSPVYPQEPHPSWRLCLTDNLMCSTLFMSIIAALVSFACSKGDREWLLFFSSTLVLWSVCSRIRETSCNLSGSITRVLAVLMRFHFVDRCRNTSRWRTEFITKTSVWVLTIDLNLEIQIHRLVFILLFWSVDWMKVQSVLFL